MNRSEVGILLVNDRDEELELALPALGCEALGDRFMAAIGRGEALDFLFRRGVFSQRSSERLPKLILLGLRLADGGGMEVLREIKSDTRTRSIPVVILAATADEEDLKMAYDVGANGYVQKPVDRGELRGVLETIGVYWLAVNQPPVSDPIAPLQAKR